MTEILILYILSKYDATIYKIQKLINEKFFMLLSPSLGTVTPALRRLEGLSCVEFESKMTEGGRLTKTYKISPFGQKYFKSTALAFEFKNRASVINNVCALMCMTDAFEDEEKQELFRNCLGALAALKTDMLSALENPYNMYTEAQKDAVNFNLSIVEKLIGELQ